MTDFLLTMRLRAPLISNDPISLDAYLSGALYRGGMDGATAAKCSYIERWKNIPQASHVFFDDDYKIMERKFNRMAARTHITSPWFGIDMIGKLPPQMATNNSQTADYVIETSHTAIETAHIHFIGSGDEDAISEVIESHPFIGARRAGGYGEIDSHVFQAYEPEDDDITGIVHKGALIRPVPTSLLSQLPEGLSMRRTHGRWESPYHPSEAIRLGYTTEPILWPNTQRLTDAVL